MLHIRTDFAAEMLSACVSRPTRNSSATAGLGLTGLLPCRWLGSSDLDGLGTAQRRQVHEPHFGWLGQATRLCRSTQQLVYDGFDVNHSCIEKFNARRRAVAQ